VNTGVLVKAPLILLSKEKKMQVIKFDTNALQSLNRALIGFDRMFDDFENRWANSVQTNYPPHNVLKTGENSYEVQIAVTGFTKEEISIEVNNDHLVIKGSRLQDDDENTVYLYRGLATRDFQKIFPLADHVEVKSSGMKNGILTIYLERIVPESLKPRVIPIISE
jgi:molecular chaperone IbpA|tara:strand:+ start:190 stop:687 length:498 start_codon:yes stop_codon:yes gene_type:complete